MKKFGLFGVATGVFAQMGEACWYNTIEATHEKLKTEDQVVAVPCECSTTNVVYTYPVLPKDWAAENNRFFIPSGKLNERQRKQVEVEIYDKDVKQTKKKVLIFEKVDGKIKTFERQEKDLHYERGFNHIHKKEDAEEQKKDDSKKEHTSGIIHLGGYYQHDEEDSGKSKQEGSSKGSKQEKSTASKNSKEDKNSGNSKEEEKSRSSKDENNSGKSKEDKSSGKEVGSKKENDKKVKENYGKDFVLPDNDYIDEIIEDGDEHGVKRIIKLCIDSQHIAKNVKKTFLSNLKGRIQGFLGYQNQRRAFFKKNLGEHDKKIEEIKNREKKNKYNALQEEEDKANVQLKFHENKLNNIRFKLNQFFQLKEKLKNDTGVDKKIASIEEEIKNLKNQEAACVKDHTIVSDKVKKVKEEKENKGKNDDKELKDLQKIKKELQKAKNDKKEEEYRENKYEEVCKTIEKVHEEVKKQIDVNIVKCENVEVVKTVVENKNVKVVITKNDFSKYLNERFGRSEESKNIRVDETQEVKIKKVNIYSQEWSNKYGLSSIERFEQGPKRNNQKDNKNDVNDFKCDDTPDDQGDECVIDKINGNSIYAHNKNDNSEFVLILGACSNLEIKGDKEIPAIGDIIIFKGKKEIVQEAVAEKKDAKAAEKKTKEAEINAKQDAQKDAVWAKKEAKVYKVKHAICY